MRTFKFASSSGDETHTTTLHADGRLTCTCRGFRSPSKCWHVKKVAVEENLNITIAGEIFGKGTALPRQVATAARQVNALSTSGFIAPMLASALKDGDTIERFEKLVGWHLEIKYDGERIILEVRDDGSHTAWARSGKVRLPGDNGWPHHVAKLTAKLAPGTYDGELYLPGGTSTDVKAEVHQRKLRLVLFDILKVGPHSAMDRTNTYRRQLLETAVERLDMRETAIHVAPPFPVTKAGLQALWDAGGEGAIVKRSDARYQAGRRSQDWVKFKKGGKAEVTITGFKKGKLGDQAVILADDDHGVKDIRVKARNDEWREMFGADPERYIGRRMVISYLGKADGGRYTQPHADHILEGE